MGYYQEYFECSKRKKGSLDAENIEFCNLEYQPKIAIENIIIF